MEGEISGLSLMSTSRVCDKNDPSSSDGKAACALGLRREEGVTKMDNSELSRPGVEDKTASLERENVKQVHGECVMRQVLFVMVYFTVCLLACLLWLLIVFI